MKKAYKKIMKIFKKSVGKKSKNRRAIELSILLIITTDGIKFGMFEVAVSVIAAAAIVIGVPAIAQCISKTHAHHKKRLELIKSYQERNNFQLNYAVERSNNIQEVKQDDERIYIESLVPVSEEELDMIKETVPECDKQDIAKIKAYEAKQKEISTETDNSKLQILKQELMRLSFELQDIATSHNLFIKKCETPQEIYDNREELQKAKTLTIK